MQKALWIILSALVLSIVAPNAHADSFTPAFTCLNACVSTPTAPDVSFPANAITETWDGFTITVPLDPIAYKPSDDYSWTNLISIVDELEDRAVFLIVDTTNNVPFPSINQILLGPQAEHPTDTGLLSFSPVAAPEPSSLALMLLGIGLVFLVQKRTSPGLSRASERFVADEARVGGRLGVP